MSNCAYSLFKLGQNDLAQQMVKKSLRSLPGNPYALRTRGMLHLTAGDKEKACEDLCLAKASGKFKELDRIVSKNCDGYPCRR